MVMRTGGSAGKCSGKADRERVEIHFGDETEREGPPKSTLLPDLSMFNDVVLSHFEVVC